MTTIDTDPISARAHSAWLAIHALKAPGKDPILAWEGERYITIAERARRAIRRARLIEADAERVRGLLAEAIEAGAALKAIRPQANLICADNDGNMGITGLRWWLGSRNDAGPVPMVAIWAFVAGGSVSDLRDALGVPAPAQSRSPWTAV